MTRILAVLALAPLLGCGGGGDPAPGPSDAEVEALQQAVTELSDELAAVRADVNANTTELDRVDDAVVDAASRLDGHDADLDGLAVRVEAQELASAATSGALAGLESQLYDPDQGDVPLLQQADADAASERATLQASIDANTAASGANTTALASLGTTVTAHDGAISLLNAEVVDHDARLDDQAADLASAQADLLALEQQVGVHEATLAVLVSDGDARDQRLDLAEQDIASNQSAVAANSAAIANNTVASAANSSSLVALESEVATLDGDVAAIQSNYLPPLDDLLLYLSADPTTDRVTVAAADLFVDGRVISDDLSFRKCDGVNYSCTPQECVDLCQANEERIATTDEVLAWAAEGQQTCQWAWMIDRNNPSTPVYGYPMYFSRLNPGCGPTNTGDVPRFGDGPYPSTWDTPTEFNCACTSR